MDAVMSIASVVGVVVVVALLLMTALPPKRDGSIQVEKFLPPLHAGYKPRPGVSKPKRTRYPKPPPGPGGCSQRSSHEEDSKS